MDIEEFQRCIQELEEISQTFQDGWRIESRDDFQNGKYLVRKSRKAFGEDKVIVTFEHHVAYSISYSVPVLCFIAWKQDGSLLSLEEYWSKNKMLHGSNKMETITQLDHPVLCRPFLTLHPCKTREILDSFQGKSKNIVVSWLSTMGPFASLDLLDCYSTSC